MWAANENEEVENVFRLLDRLLLPANYEHVNDCTQETYN